MSSEINSSQFYSALEPFTDFSDLLNSAHFIEVPRDWWVLITDIRGSTKAIQDGKYKQVNMLGAACITCVLNLNPSLDIPFVFGGDGATLLVPESMRDHALAELAKLQRLAKEEFFMDLRVGAVSLSSSELVKHSLRIAKYQLSPGNYTAQFRGTALLEAEGLVKSNDPAVKLIQFFGGPADPNLKGLSCRISPVASKNGEILSLICRAHGVEKDRSMMEIISGLHLILNNDFRKANPVGLDRISWPWPIDTLKEETLFQKQKRPFWLQWLMTSAWTLFSGSSLRFNIKMGSFLPAKYKPELLKNCDFKKYDETLRMVLDCSQEQILKIEKLFHKFESEDKITYGIHKSDEALITCMVFSATQNKHTHFVDGAGGGYAYAAVQFKRGLKL